MMLFSYILKNYQDINVPKVYEKISSNRLLSMNFLKGRKLLDFKKVQKLIERKLQSICLRPGTFHFTNME